MGLCRTNVHLDRDNWTKAQQLGKQQERSGAWIVNKALEQYLNKHMPKEAKPSVPAAKKSEAMSYPPQLNIPAWEEWKQYRKEMKMKAYKPTPRSEGATVKKLIEMSEGDHQVQALIIKQSMENTWQGLFELRGNYAANQSKANAASNRKLSAAEENENRLRQLYGNNSMEGNQSSGCGVHTPSNDGHLQQPMEAHQATIELGADDWRVID